MIERRAEIVMSPPPPPPMEIPRSVREWDAMSVRSERRERSPSAKPRKSRRNSSPAPRSEYQEEERGESNSMDVRPLALLLPERRNPERIKSEIRALEAEKKALKYEREMDKEHKRAEKYREGEMYIEKDRDVVKIEKDRKGRMSLVR